MLHPFERQYSTRPEQLSHTFSSQECRWKYNEYKMYLWLTQVQVSLYPLFDCSKQWFSLKREKSQHFVLHFTPEELMHRHMHGCYFFFLGGEEMADCRRGEAKAICSCIRKRSLSASLLSPQVRRFNWFIAACVSSPPCSPCSPNPKPQFLMKSTQWHSKMCCLGKILTVGKLLLKNAMYLSMECCKSSMSFDAMGFAGEICLWTTE